MLEVLTMKVCTRCGKEKAIEEYNYSSEKGKKINTCKECRVDQKRERDRLDPYEKKRRTRNSNLKRKFGITIDEYDEMLFEQGGECFICGEKQNGNKELSVDHDHVTGKIRSLLCSRCNTFVGYVESNPNLLSKVMDYIKSYKLC